MPWLVAWVVRLAAVFAVLDLINPIERHPPNIRPLMDVMIAGTTFAAAIFSAGAQLVLARGLYRRKRRAWTLAVIAVSIGALTHVLGHRWSVVVVNLAVLSLLIWTRQDFTAKSERAGRLAAVRVLIVMLTVSIVGGLFITYRTAPQAPFGDRLIEVLVGLGGFTPELTFRRPGGGAFTEVVLNTLGGLTALLTLLRLLAPARKKSALSARDEVKLRGLLTSYGDRDSLGYFALRGDKVAIFSPSGKAAIVYRVVGSVTLASGDPLGDPEAWPGAIQAWLDEAHSYAWTPGVVGASEDGAIAYKRAGLDSLELGDEALIDLVDFSLDGRSMRGVRQAVNRVKRAGYTLDVQRQNNLTAEELAEASNAAHALLGQEVERGFSMALGRIGDPRDPELVLARVFDKEGRLIAVLGFVPWGADGLSLDVMRRSRDSENGTVEFVVAGLAEQAKRLEVTRLSLNFAVFRSVFERGSRVGAGPVLRVWHRVLLLASKWWQIESLYRANVKYNPEWKPRFVCFRKAGELPRVAVAALEAEAFFQRPRLRWLAR